MALKFIGVDLTSPLNRIPAGRTSIAQNIRAYALGGISFRNLLTAAIETLGAAVHSLARLNDSTPNGPVSGYIIIGGAGTTLYAGSTAIATSMSGHPLSMITFRPNASVQPWMYIGDSAPANTVTLLTKYLGANSFGPAGTPVNFVSNGLMKVRSDGIVYKTGIREPQLAPLVSTGNIVTSATAVPLSAKTIPWTNVGGANSTNYSYNQTNPSDGTPPFIITGGGPELVAGSTILLSVIASLITPPVVNGSAPGVSPATPGPTAGSPGQFVTFPTPGSSSIIVGAFTDSSGNIIAPGGLIPIVFSIGTGTSVTVPTGASQLHVGINSVGSTPLGFSFNNNSGDFLLDWTVTINPIAANVATVGDVTAYVWGSVPGGIGTGGGSPHSGPVAQYIWKNPADGGSGIVRGITNPVPDVSPTSNSWIFDSTPENDTLPVNWSVLNPDGSVASTIPLFTPALEPEGNYADFNVCVVGSLFIPAAGTHTFTIQYKDQIMFGIGGGATLVGSFSSGLLRGQTMTVVQALPLLFGGVIDGSGSFHTATITVSFPGTGLYDVEIDWDYWSHTGRSLILTCDGVVIPPISSNIRQNVQYRYVYRSTATGALSNPSPESTAQSLPVIANSVSSIWSNDPQVDVVDYYRLDENTTNFTYVATGPNDNLGPGGTNTPIVDLLTDLELGNQLLDFDNFEPFPSIDLPQKGTVSISGGVITWLTGGAIGGTTTGFNVRWLAGTIILIGSPTSLAYILVARPTSTTSMTIPGVPDGTNLSYEIPEPILANQPLPYQFGPTDNINFTFAVGDPLRPGTLYWCKGSNLDSAPDTNQLEVTDPGETLVNGAMSGGRGVLASIKRFWVIMPNFFDLTSTVTGTQGSTWTLQETSINRGLYMPRCLAVEGGGTIFFRVSDGIHASPGGAASVSITDQDLYPLFSHENADSAPSVPQPITRNGVTVYPPDDSQPQGQRFSVVNGFLYYDYLDATSTPRTLVYDIKNHGWVWDVYQFPATIHASSEGLSQQGTLVGCADGSVRQMASAGIETGTSIVMTPAIGGKEWQHLYEVTVEYVSSNPITLSFVVSDTGNGSYGSPNIILPSSGGTLTKFNTKGGANKWKLMAFQFSSTDQFQLNMQGTTFEVKEWGSNAEYRLVNPFGDSGGEG